MTDDDFQALLAISLAELRVKQKYLQDEFSLGERGTVVLNFDEESLQFSDDHGPFVTFRVSFVGTFAPDQRTWRWSWSNSTLPHRVVTRSAQLQQLYHVIGHEIFHKDIVEADDALVGQFIALSCRLLGSLGAYAVPQGHLRIYVLLDAVIPTQLSRP